MAALREKEDDFEEIKQGKLEDGAGVTVEAHGDRFNAGAILRGDAGHTIPQTVFEKKAALINAELNKMGMGRYQWAIWFLCGFGYLLDLMWAQNLGLIATPLYQEMGVAPGAFGHIFTAFSAGLTVGALFFGLLVDIIGRKWAFNLTCLITCVFGTLIAAPVNNYDAICALSALCAFGLGGQIPVDALITLEFLPQNRRNLLALLSIFQPLGVVIASVISFGLIPKYRCDAALPACSAVADGVACCSVKSNIGWRYSMITIGAITLFVFFLRFFLFNFRESPKYLLGRGREQEAIDVLHSIAKFNRAPPPTLTLEHFAEIDQETTMNEHLAASKGPIGHKEATKTVVNDAFSRLRNLKQLFSTKLATFIFVVMAIAYLGDFWSFNLAGAYLPIILARRNVSTGTNTVTDTYRQYVYIYLPGVIGSIIALFAIQLPILGRKWSLVLAAGIQGLSMAMYTQVRSTAGYVGLNALEYICQTLFNAILYATTPELFPAYIRGSASGLLSCIGRLSGIVAPFAADKYVANASSGVLWLATGGIWLSMLVLILLPVEMRKRQAF